MSGFVSILNLDGKPINKQLLHTLTQTLSSRGPDRQDIWINEQIGMGHTLFRTTNEAEYEQQPATLDGKIYITCSARIDDRVHLVNKLGMKREINLKKTPDSELILHAYKKWGEDCLDHLLGDFAFVIWDSRVKKLFCARDRFGTNQLYYTQVKNSFIVSNSLHCMKQHPLISDTLNDKAIAGFLLFGDHTWLDKSLTVLNDVYSLLPAHQLVFYNENINIQKYWDIPDNIPLLDYQNKNDYIEHFQEVFKTAVADRIRTPSVAISMSGGIDSSSIAATVMQLQEEKKIPPVELNAVTIVYDHLLPCKERYYSGLVAKYLGIPIHYIAGDDYSFLKPAIGTTRPLEISQPSLWLDSEKKFSELSRVVLTGNSGDNAITYPSSIWKDTSILNIITNMIRLQRLYGKTPSLNTGLRTKVKNFLKNENNDINAAYPYPLWLNPDFEKRLNLKKEWKTMWSHLKEKRSVKSRYSKLESSLLRPDWSTDDILMNSSFTTSEKRDPFLDLRMVEFILALPALPWLFNKHILRQSMKDRLPNEVLYRPKTPLGALDFALIKQSENKWLSDWKMRDKTLLYINNSEITEEIFNSKINVYLNSRPFILDNWIKNS
ncbi:MAG: asparagine synthase-related protein [Campylobacterota bacterium]